MKKFLNRLYYSVFGNEWEDVSYHFDSIFIYKIMYSSKLNRYKWEDVSEFKGSSFSCKLTAEIANRTIKLNKEIMEKECLSDMLNELKIKVK